MVQRSSSQEYWNGWVHSSQRNLDPVLKHKPGEYRHFLKQNLLSFNSLKIPKSVRIIGLFTDKVSVFRLVTYLQKVQICIHHGITEMTLYVCHRLTFDLKTISYPHSGKYFVKSHLKNCHNFLWPLHFCVMTNTIKTDYPSFKNVFISFSLNTWKMNGQNLKLKGMDHNHLQLVVGRQ